MQALLFLGDKKQTPGAWLNYKRSGEALREAGRRAERLGRFPLPSPS